MTYWPHATTCVVTQLPPGQTPGSKIMFLSFSKNLGFRGSRQRRHFLSFLGPSASSVTPLWLWQKVSSQAWAYLTPG